jgi:predicted permease
MDISQTSSDEGEAPWSYPKFRFYAENQRSFGSVALHTESQVIYGGSEPERIAIEEVSATYLSTLGVRVARGSDFPDGIDAAPGAQRIALISDAMWQRAFNADPDVVGQRVVLDNEPFQIAGVLPASFRGLSGRAELLTNLSARDAQSLTQEWSLEFAMIGRLKDGTSARMAAAEAELLGPRIYEAFPMRDGMLMTSGKPRTWTAMARPLDALRTSAALRQSLLVLFAAVILVLLIACVNLANLLVARALARRREIAVRIALGAGRGRLIRLLATESFTLAVLGGAASLVIAHFGVRLISAFNPRESLRVQGLEGGIGVAGFDTVQLDGRAFVFTLLITLVVGALFGLVPAIRATRAELVTDLKDGGRGGSAGGAARASRRTLVVAEVALAVVLLAGSGLMIRSLSKLLNVDPGFDGRNVLTLRLTIPEGTFVPDSMPGFYAELRDNVAAIPGVEQVGLADCPPLNNGCNGTIMTFPDRPQSATGNAMVGVHWVTADWFKALRVPLRSGRGFAETDRLGTPRVVLINEAAARKYFPGEDPIGRKVAVYQGGFDKGAEVIGVVGDVRFGTIDSLARPDAYISYGQARITRMILFIRTAGDPLAMVGSIRQVIRRVAPTSPVYDVRTMEARVASSGSQARFSALVLGLFALVALSLAVMGIYGVMSFAVTQRRGEIGLRMALGAQRGSVLALVMRETLWLSAIGLAIGLTGAIMSARVLRTMLFDVSPTDPLTYVGMTALLIGAACVAGWIPALRAAKTDPAMVLREG